MKLDEIRKLVEEQPKDCSSCLCNKQTHFGAYTSRSKCKLTNIELYNKDFQYRPEHCPFNKALSSANKQIGELNKRVKTDNIIIIKLHNEKSRCNSLILDLQHQLQKAEQEKERQEELKEEWKRQHEYLRKERDEMFKEIDKTEEYWSNQKPNNKEARG